jgi:threonine/homoserine efflux transporter RhtA
LLGQDLTTLGVLAVGMVIAASAGATASVSNAHATG